MSMHLRIQENAVKPTLLCNSAMLYVCSVELCACPALVHVHYNACVRACVALNENVHSWARRHANVQSAASACVQACVHANNLMNVHVFISGSIHADAGACVRVTVYP